MSTDKDNIQGMKRDKWLLLGVFCVIATCTIVYVLLDRTPPPWDPADHLRSGYDYYQTLIKGDFREFGRLFFVKAQHYAPLVHLSIAVSFLPFGASRLAATFINLGALALLMFSVYWITRRLYGECADNRKSLSTAAVLATVLVSCYHFSAWLIHDLFLDYFLMAIVAASFAALIHADKFENTRRAMLFGLVAGLGMLTKQTFLFFFILPGIYVFIRVLLSKNLKAIGNLALAGIIIAAIASIWYVPHLQDIVDIYEVNRAGAISENERPLFSFASNFYYVYALIGMQMQLPFGLLFLFGLVNSLRKWRKETAIINLWLLSGLLIFAFIANKDGRYSVPLLPAAAIISVSWIVSRKQSSESKSDSLPATPSFNILRLRKALIISSAVWAVVSFFNAQYPLPGKGLYVDTLQFSWSIFNRNFFEYDHAPLRDDWSVPAIVRKIAELGSVTPKNTSQSESPKTDIPTLGIVVNIRYLNPSSVSLYSRLLSPQPSGSPVIMVEWLTSEDSTEKIESCDYLLVRGGLEKMSKDEWVSSMEYQVDKTIASKPGKFTRVDSFPIPIENAEAVIYRIER